MPHTKFHEAKRDHDCALCSRWIRRGETVTFGRGGNVTCRDCIGQDAYRHDAEREASRVPSQHEARR